MSGKIDPVARARELKERLLRSKIMRMRGSNSSTATNAGEHNMETKKEEHGLTTEPTLPSDLVE